MSTELLRVSNLKMHFPIHGGVFYRRVGTVYAVDGVSFTVGERETLGLVGESGCGKTTVGRTIMNLYDKTEGEIDGPATTSLRTDMQMIFQDPFGSLNSKHTVGHIIEEPLIIHRVGNAKERRKRVLELLARVGLPDEAMSKFPHEFSGGQRQRIGIARALALRPKLIICDEPVSALDVSIQAQVINLLLELQEEFDLSYIFIAHDLGVVKHVSDRVAVMYLGRIVEIADAEDIYANPMHPYTRALIAAIPVPDPTKAKKVESLEGEVPSPINPPSGCRFHTRCPMAQDRCRIESPELGERTPGHQVACHFV